ncbi:D-amino-acid transaminase [Phaeobacter sp. SYSU ZJ3003]|uniref:D-amino-acid transaminase n=1 Tax=Phaeobacter sp. SYSU ZJ3003 TaxID=2109330 RepID=UPI00351C527A
MSNSGNRIVYLNGDYLPETEAKVSIFDRGYLLADAVYEYTATIGGALIEFDAHMARLQRSVDELGMDYSLDREAMLAMHRELVQRNALDTGGVYLQISRGVADRDFAFPKGLKPTIMAFTQEMNFLDNPINDTGLKVVSVEDGRWMRRDIKSVQLLYTAMAKTQANEAGAHDAFFVKDGFVTEATSANAFIIRNGCIVTRALSQDILHGVTRKAVLELARRRNLAIEERAFTIAEAQEADEVFITASPVYALPVVEVDGKQVASGKPGRLTQELRQLFIDEAVARAVPGYPASAEAG